MIHLDSKRLLAEFLHKKRTSNTEFKRLKFVSETLLLLFFTMNYASPKMPVER